MIRAPRRAIDNVLSVVVPVHRFRCSSPECGYARNFRIAKSVVALRGASRPNLGALLVMFLGALLLVKVFQAMFDQGLPRQTPGPVIAKSLGYLAESKAPDLQEVCQNAFPGSFLSGNALECFPVDALVETMSASTAPGASSALRSESEWGWGPSELKKTGAWLHNSSRHWQNAAFASIPATTPGFPMTQCQRSERGRRTSESPTTTSAAVIRTPAEPPRGLRRPAQGDSLTRDGNPARPETRRGTHLCDAR
jgi:hypothetical protein